MQSKQHSVSTPCPICQSQMNVRELECPTCNITVRGEFGALTASNTVSSRFDALSADQLTFLETFLRCRGIIRDVEAALGISYPTVRARLDTMLAVLGLNDASGDGARVAATTAPDEKQSLKDILSKLDSGAIDAQSALDAIRGSSPGDIK